ncbi:MAG TPA: pyridoxal-phosphate dependent enzyme [Chthoniobacterales bacterium]
MAGEVDKNDLGRVLNGLQALTNQHRFEVLRLLREPALHFRPQAAGAPEEVGVCVSDLQEKLGLSQSTTSQYLAVLERAGLVTSRRVGQWTYWQSSAPEITAVVNFLSATLVPAPDAKAAAASGRPVALTPQDIFAARARIRAHVRHTPLEPSAPLSRISGGSTFLKWENLQVTRSCKPRGWFNRLLQLTPEERRGGILTQLTGNHGLALAYAGAQLGIPVHVFLAQAAGAETERSLRDLGADVSVHADAEAASQAAEGAAREEGRVHLSNAFDPALVAGGGTLALELLEDLPELEAVAVCATGGGLTKGIGLVLKAIRPDLRVYAVQANPTPGQSPFAGPAAPIGRGGPTIRAFPSDRQAPNPPLLAGFTDAVVSVNEEAVTAAMRWAWEEHHFAVEPAGARALAWVLLRPPELRGGRTIAVVTGGNILPSEAGLLSRP